MKVNENIIFLIIYLFGLVVYVFNNNILYQHLSNSEVNKVDQVLIKQEVSYLAHDFNNE